MQRADTWLRIIENTHATTRALPIEQKSFEHTHTHTAGASTPANRNKIILQRIRRQLRRKKKKKIELVFCTSCRCHPPLAACCCSHAYCWQIYFRLAVVGGDGRVCRTLLHAPKQRHCELEKRPAIYFDSNFGTCSFHLRRRHVLFIVCSCMLNGSKRSSESLLGLLFGLSFEFYLPTFRGRQRYSPRPEREIERERQREGEAANKIKLKLTHFEMPHTNRNTIATTHNQLALFLSPCIWLP